MHIHRRMFRRNLWVTGFQSFSVYALPAARSSWKEFRTATALPSMTIRFRLVLPCWWAHLMRPTVLSEIVSCFERCTYGMSPSRYSPFDGRVNQVLLEISNAEIDRRSCMNNVIESDYLLP